MKRIVFLATTAIVALVSSSSAFASSLTCGHGVTCAAGGPSGGNTQMGGLGGAGNGQLPFTGLDLAAFAVVAAVLIASGLALRRMGRRQQ